MKKRLQQLLLALLLINSCECRPKYFYGYQYHKLSLTSYGTGKGKKKTRKRKPQTTRLVWNYLKHEEALLQQLLHISSDEFSQLLFALERYKEPLQKVFFFS
jgi:hypothetical protein